MAVHAALHAGVHAIFDGDLRSRSCAVLRELREQSEDGNCEFFRSSIEMTIAAGEIVAGIASRHIGYLRSDVSVSRGDQIPAAPHQSTIIVIRDGADLGHGPNWWARGVSLFCIAL